jgi:opacity protein-like surface antigen
MKIKLLVAAAATVMASSAMAQSAFQGFYGQIATGYENNSVSGLNITASEPSLGSETWNASNQSFGGAPLVIGLGYNFSIAPKWLLGIGIDYSALSQKSSSFSTTTPDGGTFGGQTLEASNRYNIFVTPGYVIDKDKLVYLKAGYSGVTVKATEPNSFTEGGMTVTGPAGSQSKTLSGYVVGLGYKQIITGGFYGFAEANYMSYSKSTFSSTSDGLTTSVNPSMSSYQALVGVGYRF